MSVTHPTDVMRRFVVPVILALGLLHALDVELQVGAGIANQKTKSHGGLLSRRARR